MAARYDLPTVDDLLRLSEPRAHAVTIYAGSAPTVAEREAARTTVKSAVDRAAARLRDLGASHAEEAGLREQGRAVLDDAEVWARLSSSLAIFLTPTSNEVFVLPNELEQRVQVTDWFDVGQLVRVVVAEQHAYAVTLSIDGWSMWEATASRRAHGIGVPDDAPTDAADATNRDSVRGRAARGRLVGDEGRKTLLDRYAARVAEVVGAELDGLDPTRTTPLFVFATEPLLPMFTGALVGWSALAVPGAPDELRADQIDEAIRARLPELSAARVRAQLERMGNDHPRGLVAIDLATIGRAASMAAIDTLVFDFTQQTGGRWDPVTGAIDLDRAGPDIPSRIAVAVAASGGDVIAVRPEEASGGVWNGVAVAHLRFPLT